MPKGALLHAHLDATVNASFLLQLALKHPSIHIRISTSLSQSNLFTNLPEFRALPKEELSTMKSLTDASYEPDAWVPLKNARDNFSNALGGKEGFDQWVIGSMTINPSEAYGTHNTVEKVLFQTVSRTLYWFKLFRSGRNLLARLPFPAYAVNTPVFVLNKLKC